MPYTLTDRDVQWARRVAQRFSPTGILDRDDHASAAYIGLVKAAARYDGRAGVTFHAYARHFVEGDIRHQIRYWAARPLVLNEGTEWTLEESAPCPEPGPERMCLMRETIGAAAAIVNRLNGRRRTVALLMMQGLGPTEISERMGRTRAATGMDMTRVRRRVQAALAG